MEASLKDAIRILPDPESLARAAAGIFADAANHAISDHGRFSVALSGGSTPRNLFRILGTKYCDTVKWNSVQLFWTDERSVPPDHRESNYKLAYDELISKVSIPAVNIHRIRGELNPALAASEYEMELLRYFGTAGVPAFDFLLLGLGEDGHTASLFPGSEASLDNDHFAVPSHSESSGNWRVTVTMPVLNNATYILFLVTGKSKSGIVSKILSGGSKHLHPAGLVNPIKGQITWFLDREAASCLKEAAECPP